MAAAIVGWLTSVDLMAKRISDAAMPSYADKAVGLNIVDQEVAGPVSALW